MSDDEDERTFEEKIQHLEGLLKLQTQRTTHRTPEQTILGVDIFDDLYRFVSNSYNFNDDDDDELTSTNDTGWRNFHDMLKLFEGTDVELRKLCLFTPGDDFDEGEFPLVDI